jgi:hypothetical protein
VYGNGGTDEKHDGSRGSPPRCWSQADAPAVLALAVLVASVLVTWVLAAAIAQVASPPGALELLVLFAVTATGGWLLAHRGSRKARS